MSGFMTKGGAGGQNFDLKSAIIFSDLCKSFTNHLLESIYILAFGTIHGRFPVDSFRHFGLCPSVELEVKI